MKSAPTWDAGTGRRFDADHCGAGTVLSAAGEAEDGSWLDFEVTEPVPGLAPPVRYREATDPEWGNHALSDAYGGVVWRPTDGGIEGVPVDAAGVLVEAALAVADLRGVVGPAFLADDELAYSMKSVFGGKGSGPGVGNKNPWYDRGSKKGDAHNDTNPREFKTLAEVPLPKDFDSRLGECYPLAGRYVIDHPGSQLVHGYVENNGEGVMHGYAITPNGNVYEPITDRVYTQANADDLFHVESVATYSYNEAMLKMAGEGHWGPWDAESLAWYEERGL